MGNLVVVFDLDDTLYKEVDFLKSAYKEIAVFLSKETDKNHGVIYNNMMEYYKNGANTFKEILEFTQSKNTTVEQLITIYRNHTPNIALDVETEELLKRLKKSNVRMGLITDGRSKQQRNKIEALKLRDYFKDIIISEEFGSEKPNIRNFKYFNDKYLGCQFLYIGDNTAKDFIAPNKLGWLTVCLLDQGNNIHQQNFNVKKAQQPVFTINSISELEHILIQNQLL